MQKIRDESHIVRIYRSDGKNPRSLIGLVEEVGVEGQRAFRNLEELWAILNPSKQVRAARRRRKKFGVSEKLVSFKR